MARSWFPAALGSVAIAAGVVIGVAGAINVSSIPNPGFELELHAYLTNFYVRDAVRGSGVGTSLLSAALEWCDGHGVDVVFLWPTARSRPLYERHGFVAADALLTRQVAQHRKPA